MSPARSCLVSAAALALALGLCGALPRLPAGLLDPGAEADWWTRARQAIERAEYHATRGRGGLQAPNRAQNLRARFLRDGVELSPRGDESGGWRWRWRTTDWGRPGGLRALEPCDPASRDERVSYRRPGLLEWYVNGEQGLEQGFTVASRPPGAGRLSIRGSISTELAARPSGERGGIDFVDGRGACVLRYAGLVVHDARGERLGADLDLRGEALSIVVDDRRAAYPITVDPVMTSPAWTTDGGRLNAFYGISVATAGDVNGDGFSDVIVGALNYDHGEFEEGRAFVFLGSASGLSSTPAWTAEGDQSIARFGSSVASAGDVNGDGIGDVIVGAHQYDTGERDEGRAFVFLGSDSGLAATPAWTFDGNQVDAFLGNSVAGAGDVNGDGFGDVVVGSMGYDDLETNEGRAFVFLGSDSGLAATPAWTAESDQEGAYFGYSVASAGDVDGDGFGDLVIGARAYSNGQVSEGRAFLHLGSASGLSPSPAWTAESDQSGAEMGSSVATAGDVNGDGFADVIVGARGYSNGQSSEGRAFVYLGSDSGLVASPAWTAESDDPGGQFGHSVATAGDVNGDGFADVIIGAPLYGTTVAKGRAFAYLGSASGLAATPAWSVESDQTDASFGYSVGAAGDVNGDGFGDVIVGSPLRHETQTNEGRALVFMGSPSGPSQSADWVQGSGQASAYLGYSVAGVGDVNGDGFGDVIVGAIYYDGVATNEGRAFLYLGSASGLSASPAWTGDGGQANANFGQSVASAGDVDGDGYGDVIIGAHRYDDPDTDEGRAFVYLGSATGLESSPAWSADGNQAFARFGISVAGAGDVNGDGFGDVIVGALYYQNGQLEEGRAFVYLGSDSGLAAAPAWTAESNQPLAFFGYSVSGAGDVNGDGFSDVVIGAYAYDRGQSNEGRAFVYLGSDSGLAASPAWSAEGDQTNAYFGIAVAGAGDVNGDGFGDVIVGSHTYDGAVMDGGRAFVFPGSDSGLAAAPAWTADGDQSSDSFGISVAGAGDVNGDGFDDAIVGANAYDRGQNDEGRVFVYLGSDSGPALSPDWSAEGNQASANFGASVASAGDVNGDGFDDVIVGAPYAEGALLDEGKAFVYYGNGTDGVDRRPRQLRVDGTGPVPAPARMEAGGFRLAVEGRSPAGRGKVRMEWEAKPLGAPFDGLTTKGAVAETGAPVAGAGSVAPLGELVAGLMLDTPYRWRLRILTDSPFFPRSPWLELSHLGLGEMDLRTGGTAAAAPERSPVRGGLRLARIWPNPSATRTAISYLLPRPGPVTLTIYDVLGRRVATLVDRPQEAGAHSAVWDGRDRASDRAGSGIYFVRLESGGERRSGKLVRLF